MVKGILIGAVGTLAALAAAFYFVAASGRIPANADARPPAVERWIARKSLKAAILRGAPTTPNPVPETDANLIAGIKLYAANCAVCHGAADAAPSAIARGLYQKAPQLGRYGVEDDDDGDIYWQVDHGIRMTGMPSFRGSLSDEQIWQVVLFLKNMDSLPPAAQRAWNAVPSAAGSAASSRNREVHRG